MDALIREERSILYTFALGAFLGLVVLNMIPAVLLVDRRLAPLFVLLGICLPWLMEDIFGVSSTWIIVPGLFFCALAAGATAGNLLVNDWWLAFIFLGMHLLPCCVLTSRLVPRFGLTITLLMAVGGFLLIFYGDRIPAVNDSRFLMLLPFFVGILLFHVYTNLAQIRRAMSWHAVSGTLFYCGLYLVFNF